MSTGIKTMGALWERNAQFYGNREALVYGERRFTHAQTFERGCRLASALYNLGARRHDRIAILSENCNEAFENYFACHIAGFIAAPVNYRLAVPEIAYILKDSSPRTLIFDISYTAVVEQLRPQCPGITHYICIGAHRIGKQLPAWALDYDSVLESGSADGPPMRAREDDYAQLLYTSGTTGKPKGVIVSQRALVPWTATHSLVTDLNGASRVLQATPLFHVGGICYPFGAWWMGGMTVLLPAFDPLVVLRTIEKERITYSFMVAAMMQAVLTLPGGEKFDVSSLKRIVSAAAPIPVPLLKQAFERFGPIVSVQYGGTEFGCGCNLPSHFVRPEGTADDIKRLASVGHPVPGNGFRIVDDHGADVAVGVTGEVLFKSDSMMSGYWNNHAATLEALDDGWYRTGDLAYRDHEGFVFLVDRKKDMIISGGENIYSREVEEAIHQHPAVAESAVIGVPDPKWVEAVKAYVVLKPGASLTEDALIEHCRTLIARYKCPRQIAFITELPRIASGKINKVALRELSKSGAA